MCWAERTADGHDRAMSAAPDPVVMPMFPLGTVLLPGGVLPLQVFEPRYRAMVQHCLAADRRFGVVLIARGYEVGGDDVRTDVGTVAQMMQATEMANGLWFLVTVGTRRLRVRRWLPDDPYPRAEVEEWDDGPEAEPMDSAAYAALVRTVRRVLALAAEVGQAAGPATLEVADDPALGTFQLASALPIGPFDRQRILVADGSRARGELLGDLCRDRTEDLEGLLRLRDEDEPRP